MEATTDRSRSWERVMTFGLAGAKPFAVSVETSDLDEAREICGEHMYPRRLRVVDRPARLAARFAFLHLGGLTLADVRSSCP